MGNYQVKTTRTKQLDDINVTTLKIASNNNAYSDNNSVHLSISRVVKNTLNTNQFDHEIAWDNLHFILDESMSFNVSTRLLINNSTLEFAPKNASSHVELIIGEESQLEIYNSKLLLNSSIGKSSITFHGGTVTVVNSIFLENGNTALFVKNSKISIYNSTFDSAGLGIEESNEVIISNCVFQKIKDWGIHALNSANVSITNCSFIDIGKIGLVTFNCNKITIKDSRFTQCSEKCVQIDGEYYFNTINIKVENSIIQDSGFGIWIIGQNISILNNSLLNLTYSGLHVGGRNVIIENNTFSWVQWGISTPAITETPHIAETGYQWCETSISNITIQNNSFRNIQQYGIWINNFEFETLFRIEKNVLTDIGGAALAFTGNLGGVNSSNRSWVINNLVKNANYGVLGSYTVECPFGLVYSARFQYTSFIRNAFINCSLNYTSFESDTNSYLLNDIRWDDGFFGNYWDIYCDDSPQDEDNNKIGDLNYNVSVKYNQIDHAPLLSLDLVKQKIDIGSTHPKDLEYTKSELNDNNTLSWIIIADENADISVLLDGKQQPSEEIGTNITISLKSLKIGLHNFTLKIQAGGQVYQDLVWVKVHSNGNDINEVFILLGIFGFIATIALIVIIGFKKRNIL